MSSPSTSSEYGRRAARRALHGLGGPLINNVATPIVSRGDREHSWGGAVDRGPRRAALRWWERADAPGVGGGDLPGPRPRARRSWTSGKPPRARASRRQCPSTPRCQVHARWQTSARRAWPIEINSVAAPRARSRTASPPQLIPRLPVEWPIQPRRGGRWGRSVLPAGLPGEHIPQYLLDDAGRRHNRLSRCRALACGSPTGMRERPPRASPI